MRFSIDNENHKIKVLANSQSYTLEASINSKVAKVWWPVITLLLSLFAGSETHFKVVVVSENFHDKPLIQVWEIFPIN